MTLAIGMQEEIMFECQWNALKNWRADIISFLDDMFTMSMTNVYGMSKEQILNHVEYERMFSLLRVDIEVCTEKHSHDIQ